MRASTHDLCFRTSRLKIVPQLIVSAALLLPFSAFLLLMAAAPFMRGSPNPAHLAFAALFLAITILLLWMQYHTILRFIRPDELTIRRNGLQVSVHGHSAFYEWELIGEPEAKRLSGDGAAETLHIPIAGRRGLVLQTEEYLHRTRDILHVIREARAGTLVDMPAAPSRALYIYLAIPASLATAGTVVVLAAFISRMG